MEAPSLLTPLQQDLLQAFFTRAAGQQFFLTGGTALAEYYLHHRLSEDIDLFTLDEEAFSNAIVDLPRLAEQLRASYREQISTPTFRQVFFHIHNQQEVKIDLVREAGPQFGKHVSYGKVIVDSELNIAVNKVTAIFGRISSKDFVDLYFLLRRGFDIDELIQLAAEKDPGLDEFYLSGMMRQVQSLKSLPNMIQPVTLEELRSFFLPLAEQLMLKTKPRE